MEVVSTLAAGSVSTIPEVSTARVEGVDRVNGGVSRVAGKPATNRVGGIVLENKEWMVVTYLLS